MGPLPAQHDAAVGVLHVATVEVLAADLRGCPAGSFELRVNQLSAGIGFVERHG
jgi:hypothetical protein